MYFSVQKIWSNVRIKKKLKIKNRITRHGWESKFQIVKFPNGWRFEFEN